MSIQAIYDLNNTKFKETEIGLMPEDWDSTTLGEVVTLQRGQDLPKGEREEGHIPVIGSNGVVGYHSKSMANGIGVFVGRSGSVGKVTWIDGEYWALNTTLWCKHFHGNNPKFVYFFLSNIDLSKYASGVSVPTLNRNILHPIKVGLPPLPEQKAIAHILSIVQRAKEATEQVIDATKELKKSLMKHLFTYGAVSLEEAPNIKLKETEIGMVPEEWEQIELSDVFKLSSGTSRPDDVKKSAIGQYLYPVYGGNGILGYSSVYFLEEPTLVLGRVGEYCGSVHTSSGKSWISDNALYIKQMLSDCVSLEFLSVCLELLNLNRFKKKSGQPLITQSIVCSKVIAYPHKEQQTRIIYALNVVEKKIASETNRLKALDELFKTLLNNLMTGKIRVQNFEVPEA